jgi:hypothetical protein
VAIPNTDYPVIMMLELFRSLLIPVLKAERACCRNISLLGVGDAATFGYPEVPTLPAVKC